MTVWHDCRQIGLEGQGWPKQGGDRDYCRLPAHARGKVPEVVWELGRHTAGLCVRFRTEAPALQVRWELAGEVLAMAHMPATGVSGIDLYARSPGGRWRYLASGQPQAGSNEAAFTGWERGAELLLYLPLYNGISRMEVGIPAGMSISPVPGEPGVKPAVFYGTSITQGGCASRPGMAATAIVGRALDLPVVNLGFSGSGRMELALAELVGELEACLYVVDCLGNMDPDLVRERVAPFVHRLREARPETPILLVEDTHLFDAVPTVKGKLLRRECQGLRRQGAKALHFLSAKGMLGRDGEGTVDGGHPNDLGMMRQAQVFVRAVGALLRRPA